MERDLERQNKKDSMESFKLYRTLDIALKGAQINK